MTGLNLATLLELLDLQCRLSSELRKRMPSDYLPEPANIIVEPTPKERYRPRILQLVKPRV